MFFKYKVCKNQLLLYYHKIRLSTYLFYFFKRDGCPKIVNLGSAKTDLYYERKKYGFKKTQ